MSTVTINQTVETAVKTMLNKHTREAVELLSEKYNFDLEEALATLDLGNVRVAKKEKVVKEKPDSDDADPKPKAKSKGKGKAKSDDNKPKEKKPRKKSGYSAFCKETRPELTTELKGLNMTQLQEELGLDELPEKYKPCHVMVGLGLRWKALSEEEREEWIQQASSEEEVDALQEDSD